MPKLDTENSLDKNIYIESYKLWKEAVKKTGGYFIISNTITEYFKYINANAIKLYLYYVSVSNNNTGKSFPSVSTVAKDLDVTDRTINNSNNQLEKYEMIHRDNKDRKSSNTYLIPINDFILDTNKNELDRYKNYISFRQFKKINNINLFYFDKKANIKHCYCFYVYNKKINNEDNLIRNIYINILDKKIDNESQTVKNKLKNEPTTICWFQENNNSDISIFIPMEMVKKDSKMAYENKITLDGLNTNEKIENFKKIYKEMK